MVAVLAAGLVFVDQAIQSPFALIVGVLSITVLEALLGPFAVSVTLGAFTVRPTDVMTAVALAAIIARTGRHRPPTVLWPLFILIGGIFALSLARGITTYGPQTAINGARSLMGFFILAAYLGTFRSHDHVALVRRLWLLTATIIVGIGVMRWAAAAASVSSPAFLLPTGSEDRVVVARDALIVAQGFVLTLPVWLQDRSVLTARVVSGLLLACVVLFEHRSVWLTLIVMSCILIMRNRHIGRRLVATLMSALVLGGLVIGTVFEGTEGRVSDSLTDSATNTGTLEWRAATDEGFVDTFARSNMLEKSVGKPFGTGWQQRLDGVEVDAPPHNNYLQIALRLGLIGLAMTLAIYVAVIRTHSSARARLLPPDDLLLALLVGQLTYGLAYALTPEQGLLLGAALDQTYADRHLS